MTALRVGWLAKGVLFVLVGLLAVGLAQKSYVAEDADQRGALSSLAERPAGTLLVTAVSIGLLGYAAWQMWSVFGDREGLLAQVKRVGTFGLSLSYGALAIDGLRLAWISPERSPDGDGEALTSPEGIADRVLALPVGVVLVIAIGIGVLVVGAYHLQKGVRGEFLDDIDTDDLDRLGRRTLRTLGTTGFIGRAAVLGIAGWLLIDAALRHSPDRAAGMDQSLRALLDAPAGPTLLTATGLAIACAGVYDAVTFRRQRVD
ncbi:MAG: membrane protein [Acidimicrobiales bacterium]|nr:MAG: membrane protein [Acidimicrobiales bacterium]